MSLRQVAEAAGVKWDMRKTNMGKGDWWAPCPLHGEKTSSFHVVEKAGTGGFFKCFGCGEGGTVIDFVSKLHGIGFVDAVRRLADEAGIAGELSDEKRREMERQREKARAKVKEEAEADATRKHNIARDLWARARPAETGDLLAQYLNARGVNLAAMGGTPATLRMHKSLPHRENGGQTTLHGPAQIAAIGREKLLGVHRTWITATGRARYANGKKVSKQWIGKTGHLMGQPCVLSQPTSAVVVGEGIETTAAAFSALLSAGQVGWCAEAALSRGAITGPTQDPTQLWTPRPGTAEVLILGEGSSKNPRQARELYEGAEARLKSLGLKTLLTVPHGRWDLDADFADLAVDEFLKG